MNAKNIGIAKWKCIFFLFSIFPFHAFAQTETQHDMLSGLYFSSHEVHQDLRTSLNLSPEKPFRFYGNFSLEFDVNFRQGDGYFGYIFRIIGNHNLNIDLVANQANSESNIWLVYKDKILLSYRRDELPDVDYGKWVRIKLDVNIAQSVISLTINGKSQSIVVDAFNDNRYYDIVFGACRLSAFYSVDVCPMSVRNIRIYINDNQLFRYWELRKHAVDRVYDETEFAEAAVENPVWLIDKYTKWRKLKNIHIDNLHGITNDSTNRRLFLVNHRAVYSLDLTTLALDSIPYYGNSPYSISTEKSIIYNPYTNEIWSYDFTKPIISRFDFVSGKWSPRQDMSFESDYAHHNVFISPVDSSLVTLFGYGHYTYKSIVNIHKKGDGEWRRIDQKDQIGPRYLAAAGMAGDNKALVFGGYGSNSGRQELSPSTYYDLHLFDFENYSFRHLWTMPEQTPQFVPSATLVCDAEADHFYTLTYNYGVYNIRLMLAEIGISQPVIRFIGDAIPALFHDTETWIYLYLNEAKTDLIAVVSHNDDISLYAIAYRPLTAAEVTQAGPRRVSPFRLGLIAVAALLLIAIIIFTIRVLRRRILNRQHKEAITPIPTPERTHISAIYMMGGFQAFGPQADEIANLSITSKQLFLFIFFNSIKKGKGVTSQRVDETLYPNRVGDSARNNRNVGISKLRKFFDSVGGITIACTNSLWHITTAPEFYCDYTEICSILDKAKRDGTLAYDEAVRLLGLLNAGEFLPNMTRHGWLNAYKSEFAKETIDTLTMLLRKETTYPDNLQYYMAEYLLAHTFNEDAIRIKCAILKKLGWHNDAKVAYNNFVKEYEKAMGKHHSKRKLRQN